MYQFLVLTAPSNQKNLYIYIKVYTSTSLQNTDFYFSQHVKIQRNYLSVSTSEFYFSILILKSHQNEPVPTRGIT
jgi:hypothetical protein